jgi:hypothetical protein
MPIKVSTTPVTTITEILPIEFIKKNEITGCINWLGKKDCDGYLRHIKAMTDEGLQSKADIAAELGHRDIEIDRLLGIITMAHDRLLRGDDDKELLDLLAAGWSERPNAELTRRSTAIENEMAAIGRVE